MGKIGGEEISQAISDGGQRIAQKRREGDAGLCILEVAR